MLFLKKVATLQFKKLETSHNCAVLLIQGHEPECNGDPRSEIREVNILASSTWQLKNK
jgi:hypothetical protein